jgi:hypothetical protein
LNQVRFTCGVAKEFKIKLIVICTFGWHLFHQKIKTLDKTHK